MTPATHAAVGAVIASRTRNVALGLAAAFLSHFVLDAFYHFEAFYPLSVPEGWTYEQAMAALATGLGLMAIPAAAWFLRKDKKVMRAAAYALLLCALLLEPRPYWRLPEALLLSGLFAFISPAEVRSWIWFGFAAFLPDLLKNISPGFDRLHEAFHYNSNLDLGDWVSLWLRGRWRLHVNLRIYDPYYLAGYVLEVLLEGSILFGSFYFLMQRKAPMAQPAPAEAESVLEETATSG